VPEHCIPRQSVFKWALGPTERQLLRPLWSTRYAHVRNSGYPTAALRSKNLCLNFGTPWGRPVQRSDPNSQLLWQWLSSRVPCAQSVAIRLASNPLADDRGAFPSRERFAGCKNGASGHACSAKFVRIWKSGSSQLSRLRCKVCSNAQPVWRREYSKNYSDIVRHEERSSPRSLICRVSSRAWLSCSNVGSPQRRSSRYISLGSI
jgi:hypothetical protein